jgi:hypothetical protein
MIRNEQSIREHRPARLTDERGGFAEHWAGLREAGLNDVELSPSSIELNRFKEGDVITTLALATACSRTSAGDSETQNALSRLSTKRVTPAGPFRTECVPAHPFSG